MSSPKPWSEWFSKYPQHDGEMDKDYFMRLADIKEVHANFEGIKRHYYRRKRIAPVSVTPAPEKSAEEIFADDRKERALRAVLLDYKKKYETAIRELEHAEKRIDAIIGIQEPVDIIRITVPQSSEKRNAVAQVTFSDWHVEERIEGKTVNYLNEFNPDIAQKRTVKVTQNALKLVRNFRRDVNIETLVLELLGDFINGYIHEEYMQSNFMTPLEATRFAKQLLISSIEFLLQYGEFKKVIIMCKVGNHGRNTKRMYSGYSYKNSYEYYMYHDLKDYFKNDSRIEFHIPESVLGHLEIFGKVIRYFHGENVNYSGGVGGISIPLLKYIARCNSSQLAHYNKLGHFHTHFFPSPKSMINGCLCGFNSYAQQLGFEPEPPVQALVIQDEKRGFTIKAPICCE